MKSYNNPQERKKVLNLLMAKFRQGKQYSVSDMVEIYFKPTNLLSALKAEDKVRAWMRVIKQRFYREGINFGCIHDGLYGVADSDAKNRALVNRSYRLTKGIVNNAQRNVINARANGFLLDAQDEEILLPVVAEAE